MRPAASIEHEWHSRLGDLDAVPVAQVRLPARRRMAAGARASVGSIVPHVLLPLPSFSESVKHQQILT